MKKRTRRLDEASQTSYNFINKTLQLSKRKKKKKKKKKERKKGSAL